MPTLDFRAADRVAKLRAQMAAQRHGPIRTWLHRRMRSVWSDFDVNAWLGMYPMSFLSTDEWRTLLPQASGSMLDIGAGSGDLTRALAPLHARVVCTETSRGMAKKLRGLGFATHRIDLTNENLPGGEKFDTVALLHVVDRCSQPLRLIERAVTHLRVGGNFVLAVPLPYDPSVDVGDQTLEPEERLIPQDDDVERSCERIAVLLADRFHVKVQRMARVPYLCPGDSEVVDYSLDSFVFVGRKRDGD